MFYYSTHEYKVTRVINYIFHEFFVVFFFWHVKNAGSADSVFVVKPSQALATT